MYKEHFGFKFSPFSIAPDPHYLYMSDQHREALAHLLYGIKGDGGFVLLTGEVGTGKTTVCRCLLEQLPEKTDIAIVLNPKLSAQELLATICEEFGIETDAANISSKFLIDYLNRYLLKTHAQGRHCILIIDEAQNLSAEVLEQLRLLTNLETNERKLLQIILIGQPELKELLEKPELRQLAQRVTARYHLSPLSQKEVGAYIAHRLAVAGIHRHLSRQLFPPAVQKKIYTISQGVPRLINIICDRALLGTYVQGGDTVDRATVKKAAKEVFGETGERRRPSRITAAWIFSCLIVTLCLAAAVFYYFDRNGKTTGQIADSSVAQPVATSSAPPELEKHKQPQDAHPAEQLPITAPPPAAEHSATGEPSPTMETAGVPPPETVPLSWPGNIPLAQSKPLAYEALFKAWGAPLPPGKIDSVCQSAPANNLRCLHLKSSLDSLIHLNRPAVLTLYTDDRKEYFATLSAIAGETATFIIGGEPAVVQQSEIWAHWNGDYTLLWLAPPGYNESIRPGDKGPEVEWLSQRLAEIDGVEAGSSKTSLYDDALVDRIKKFQFAMHLVPDGVVGAQTIIHLNSASRVQVPKLINSGGTR